MKRFIITCLAVLILSSWSNLLQAQPNERQLPAIILQQDSLFWQAYNNCDVAEMTTFFSEDVEFYHDKGGPTFGLQALTEATKKGLCNEASNTRLRREAVEGSIKVFPLKASGKIYGAVISGEHVFYILEKGKKDRLDGLARFTHLWLLKDNTWKMTRILSYDHGPAPYISKRKAIALPENILMRYTGKYKDPQTGVVEVRAENGRLTLQIGGDTIILYAEKENLFFMKERDLTFEFIKGSKNDITKLIVREGGNIAEELLVVQ